MEQAIDTAIAIELPPVAVAAPPAARLKVSARFLLGIYVILPLCFVPMIVDRLFWDRKLFDLLPSSPENYFYFQLIFGTPHIIASSILLAANGEYVRAFWLRVLLFTIVLLAFFGIANALLPVDQSYPIFLAIVGAVTVMHVIKQQVGIGRGMCRQVGLIYEVWGWTLVVFGSILYYAVYMGATFTPTTAQYIHTSLWMLAGIATVLALVIHPRIPTTMGRLYFWANLAMVLQAGMFYACDYPFLAILGPRLVHDLTAFTFYVAHDVNRHGSSPRSLLYRAASKLGLGVFWVCPVLAVLLTYLIGEYTDTSINFILTTTLGYDVHELTRRLYGFEVRYAASFLIIGYLGMLHYYTEAFTWRHGSPYRQHLSMGN